MAILNKTTITTITVIILVFFLISCSIMSSALHAPLMIKCEDTPIQLKKKKKIIKYF